MNEQGRLLLGGWVVLLGCLFAAGATSMKANGIEAGAPPPARLSLKPELEARRLDILRSGLSLLILSQPAPPDPREDISCDVFPASKEHPRNSEGSIIELRDGSLLYAVTRFIGGSADASNAEIVARKSPDGGRSWGPVRVLQENVGRQNVMSVAYKSLVFVKDRAVLSYYVAGSDGLSSRFRSLPVSWFYEDGGGEP